MAHHYSPKISSDGLILALDAANPKSYPGSGNTWYDLSPNNNHAAANGFVSNPVFQTNYGGRFYFNGTTSKSYFQSSTYAGLENILNCTIVVWAEWVPSSTSRYYAFDTRVGTPNYGAGIGFDKESSTTASPFHFFNDTTGYDEATSPTNFQQNRPYHLVATRTSNSMQITDTAGDTYISPNLSSNTLGTNPIAQMGPYRVGAFNGGGSGTTEYWWSGYIYAVWMYSRALSDEELFLNYEAHRSRFGL